MISTIRWSGVLLSMSLAAAACAAPPGPAPGPAAAAAEEAPLVEEPARLETATGTVHGTLLVPASEQPVPVALIIAGSGPTDRDGNSAALPGQNNSLRLLAEGLAARGIASLRYDKRGVAESGRAGPSEAELLLDTYVDDAAAWLTKLRDDPRFSAVVAIGHSEGSLIGMLASREAEVDGLVSLAGIARAAPAVLRDQLRPQLTGELWDASERILESLERGETADSIPPVLLALYRPSVQPYLISWFRHDPAEIVAGLGIPVLIVQGTTDIQVAVGEAEALSAALPAAELEIIEGMNHVLKTVPADAARQMASYSDPALPLAPGLVERLASFIRSVAEQARRE